MKRALPIVLLAAIVLTGIAWATLRISIESQLTKTAQRDLQTIADLVAADIERVAETLPLLKGAALAKMATSAGSGLAQALQRASDERFRDVYFFDAAGHVTTVGDSSPTEPGTLTAPRIVRQALAARTAAPPVDHGGLTEAYRNRHDDEVIGAWRWLPQRDLGVVAERPYERFVQPLDWVDAIFAVWLAVLVVGVFLVNPRALADLRAAFRRSDIQYCGPYRIERLLGEGTMSNVYLARHQQLGRLVALKRLKIQAQTDELSERFDREARLASQLSHPNIVTVLDHGPVPEGGFFYTMEFIRGLTLTQWVEQYGPLPPARAVRLLRQICDGLAAMHRAGLLHRDMKPDNVMAYAANGDYDLVKLLDFGLIKDLEGNETRDLTRNVRVLGTPAYMAPERLNDPRNVDPRTDLYGVGCIAFFLLTGRKPFEARSDADLAQQIMHVDAPTVAGLSPFPISDRLAELIAATLAKDMALRPADAEAMAAELAAIASNVPWRAELARLWWQSAFADAA